MNNARKPTSYGGLLLLLFVFVSLTCNQAIPTAPPGSSISVFANPDSIPANGGVSVITAFILEPAGTPVADGTVVQFFTNLGRIEEQGRTNDGVARVNLVSDSRSGTANVCAVSGGEGNGGGGGTTTSSSQPAAFAASTASCAGAETPVKIGSARPTVVVVTAFPTHITTGLASQVVANVFDGDGNTVANVPVIFTVNGPTESMGSQGTPTYTDNNGQARDLMRTKHKGDRTTVTVTALVPTGSGGDCGAAPAPSPSPSATPFAPMGAWAGAEALASQPLSTGSLCGTVDIVIN